MIIKDSQLNNMVISHYIFELSLNLVTLIRWEALFGYGIVTRIPLDFFCFELSINVSFFVTMHHVYTELPSIQVCCCVNCNTVWIAVDWWYRIVTAVISNNILYGHYMSLWLWWRFTMVGCKLLPFINIWNIEAIIDRQQVCFSLT